MQAIKSSDTKPELLLRRFLHGAGYRYRKNLRGLPGRPDIVFTARRKIIFMHGCFWHAHDDPACRNSQSPKTNSQFWSDKLRRTKERDAAAVTQLVQDGWQVLVVWECDLIDFERTKGRILSFLGDAKFIQRGGEGAPEN